jgi:hypothetical protein
LMKCALLLVINLSTFKALDNVRVWRSQAESAPFHVGEEIR